MKNRALFMALMYSTIPFYIECRAPLFIATIPKSGTHMLSKAIRLMTGGVVYWGRKVDTVDPYEIENLKSNQYYLLHGLCTPFNYETIEQNRFKVILLIRDPRDVLISWAHWLKESPKNKEFYEHIPLNQLISDLIKNYRLSHLKKQTIVEFYNQYLCWQNYPDIYVTTFEKLVGPQGGGDQRTQENELLNIAHFLEINLTQHEVAAIKSEMYGNTKTFREGKIGSWKKELTDEQKQALKAIPGFNNLLRELKYEKDNNW